MTRKNVTRADLAKAVYQKMGLSRLESVDLVDQVLDGICNCLAAGKRKVCKTDDSPH